MDYNKYAKFVDAIVQPTHRTAMNLHRITIGFLLLPFLAMPLHADVRLPGFYSNHMVLQQEMTLRFWGWAAEGEVVTVTLGQHVASAKAGSDGTWNVELPAMEGSNDSYVLRFEGKNKIELRDVMIGEVWLCSGQSNMEWTVRASTNAAEEIAAANYPGIRHMKVAHRPSTVPIDDVDSEWQICSPETAGNFTACGYFMARKLHQELNVPHWPGQFVMGRHSSRAVDAARRIQTGPSSRRNLPVGHRSDSWDR